MSQVEIFRGNWVEAETVKRIQVKRGIPAKLIITYFDEEMRPEIHEYKTLRKAQNAAKRIADIVNGDGLLFDEDDSPSGGPDGDGGIPVKVVSRDSEKVVVDMKSRRTVA